jgi:hypothetical protein
LLFWLGGRCPGGYLRGGAVWEEEAVGIDVGDDAVELRGGIRKDASRVEGLEWLW